ncbi:MAG: helix-turn-helix domain-containing protein [Treponema sp.]|jgi:transcriptional regulator with XRE-family HTH domain|nr:helix-turn-helix domain-containing protein [Treponema sp.]
MFLILSIPKHNIIIREGVYMTERELLKILSANIKLYRELSRWTQAQLAEKIDISINFLSDIETGKKWASPNTMVKLADAFSVEVYELLKPSYALPANTTNLILKYTSDISKAIKEVRNDYIDKLNSPGFQ